MIYVHICENPDRLENKYKSANKDKQFYSFNTKQFSIFNHIKKTREAIRLYYFCKNKDEVVDLVIFTDSDFVMREINNMFMLGKVKNIENKLIIKEYNEYMRIKEEDIKVFSLDGSEVEPTFLGFPAPEFDDLIDNQNTMQGEITEELAKERE